MILIWGLKHKNQWISNIDIKTFITSIVLVKKKKLRIILRLRFKSSQIKIKILP